MPAALLRTPLSDRHVAAGAKVGPFAGWEMPLYYSTVREEHRAVREGAGLFDVSHMGQLEVTGPGARAYLLCKPHVNMEGESWLLSGEAAGSEAGSSLRSVRTVSRIPWLAGSAPSFDAPRTTARLGPLRPPSSSS